MTRTILRSGLMLGCAMLIWGSIGIFRRYIPELPAPDCGAADHGSKQ